jgi:hypothetical protein
VVDGEVDGDVEVEGDKEADGETDREGDTDTDDVVDGSTMPTQSSESLNMREQRAWVSHEPSPMMATVVHWPLQSITSPAEEHERARNDAQAGSVTCWGETRGRASW